MKKRELEQYRQQLIEMRDRLSGVVTAVTEQALQPSGGQGESELSNAPMHLADMGTDEFMHGLNATLLENEEELIADVRAALDRLDDGSFGVCDNCNQEIAQERLRAMPFVRHCVVCAEAIDHRETSNLNRGRPASPQDTLAPEGEMNENRSGVSSPLADLSSQNDEEYVDDVHAAGTAGGGTAVGGLAGTNIGHGEPSIGDLQQATGSGEFERDDARDQDDDAPLAARNGAAIRGTPKNRRPR